MLLSAAHASAQPASLPGAPGSDTVAVAANPAYAAGPLKRFLLGDAYRDLWTVPARVPVLDLDRFAGGMELVEGGGRKQTLSLRFRGADGREYLFRSVDKVPLLARSPDFEGTAAGRLVRDQTSALFPAAAVVLPPLLEAAGVIHAVPRLAVMPDGARLGEHRAVYDAVSGATVGSIGRPGRGPGEFRRPNGILVLGDLAFDVERDNRRVQVLRLPGGQYVGSFGQGVLRSPYGIAAVERGEAEWEVYVTDAYTRVLGRIPPDRELGERVKRFRVRVSGDSLGAELLGSFGDTSGPGVRRQVESIYPTRGTGS